MHRLKPRLNAEFEANRQVVLVTLIETQGSTYRKAGAQLLITETGAFQGLISGGCLEGDLALHAKRVFATGKSILIEYDMREEEEGLWVQALGCRGLVRLHMQLLSPGESIPAVLATEIAEQNLQPALYVADMRAGLQGQAPALVLPNADLLGAPLDLSAAIRFGDLRPEVEAAFSEIWQETRDSFRKQVTHTRYCDEGQPVPGVYLQLFKPRFRLLLLGGGPDVMPVIKAACEQNMAVTVSDYRPAYLGKLRSELIEQAQKRDDAGARSFAFSMIDSEPADLPGRIVIDSYDAVVVMSHNLTADETYLRGLVPTNIGYIGLLGPKERADYLFQKLGDAAWARLQDRLRSPVGLNLGGEGPEAIALSIVSEIQQFKYQKA